VFSKKSKFEIVLEKRLSLSVLSQLDYEIVIVEDNSPDGTWEVAMDLQKLFGKDKIKVHSRPGKLGLGSAYRDGLVLCTGDFVILMDADMSHHPKHIPEFIKYATFFLTVNLVLSISCLESSGKTIMMSSLAHDMPMVEG
jgi:dolichol-phosphate mannosyltransferase